MSQTETMMVLALGSALTFVFFLLFGRVFWNMASSSGSRRRNKQMPVEMLELQADRDRLRAEHALMSRKLDLRLDDIKLRMAEQMAEVSRNRNRVQTLLIDLETKTDALKIKDQEVASIKTQLDIAHTELQAARQTIENMGTDGDRREAELARLQDDFRRLSNNLREKNALVTNLNEELRHALVPGSTHQALTSATDSDSRIRQRVAELTTISVDLARDQDVAVLEPVAKSVFEANPNRASNLQFRMEETERHAQAMEKELHDIDKMLARGPETALPAEPAKRTGAIANVISLAQRIRALQHGINE